MDVLVVQHVKWIARRLQRSLGHFNTPARERPTRPRTQFSTAKMPSRGRLQTLHDGIRNPSTSRASVKRRPGRPPKTSLAAGGESAVDAGRELSLSFEQEVDADADAQEDYRTLRAREAEVIHSVKVVEHGGGSAQPSSAAEVAHPFHPLPSPLPNGVIGVGESASTTSGCYPLQSEVHSTVNSNFGALQVVAQPAAQLAEQSFAQPEP